MNKKNSRFSDLTALLRYRPKHTEQDRAHVCNFASTRTMLSSVLCMFICAICLCGATWAWFTSTSSVDITTIVSAEWNPSIMVYDPSVTNGDTNATSLYGDEQEKASDDAVADGQLLDNSEADGDGTAVGEQEQGKASEQTGNVATEEETKKETDAKSEEKQGEKVTEDTEKEEEKDAEKSIQQEQSSEEQQQGSEDVKTTPTAASDTTNAPVLMLLSAQVSENVIESDPSPSKESGDTESDITNNVESVTDGGDNENNSPIEGIVGANNIYSGNDVWQGVKYTKLDTEETYIVALSVTGSRAGATGCFKIEAGSTTYYTDDLMLNGSEGVFGASLTLKVMSISEMIITPMWGTPTGRGNDNTIGSTGNITTYTTSDQQETALAVANEIGGTAESKGEEKKAEGEQTTTDPQQSDSNTSGTVNDNTGNTSTENGTGTETGTDTITGGDGTKASTDSTTGADGSTETKQEAETKSGTDGSDGAAEDSEDKSDSTGTGSTESTGGGDKTDKTNDTDTTGGGVTDDSSKQSETVQQSETNEKEKAVVESSGSADGENDGNESSGSSDAETNETESGGKTITAASDGAPVAL